MAYFIMCIIGYLLGVNHFFCVLDGYWLRTPPLTEPVRNAAA